MIARLALRAFFTAERRQARANLGRGYRRSSSGSLAMLAAMRRASALILQREARSDDANELGANFMAVPPDHLYVLSRTTPSTDRNSTNSSGTLNPATWSRRRSLTCRLRCSRALECQLRLDLRHAVMPAARRPASLLRHRRAHSGRLQVWPPQHLSMNYIAEQRLWAAYKGRTRIFLAFTYNLAAADSGPNVSVLI